jgi:hypothetical protein
MLNPVVESDAYTIYKIQKEHCDLYHKMSVALNFKGT